MQGKSDGVTGVRQTTKYLSESTKSETENILVKFKHTYEVAVQMAY
jgi:hypothetical protein